MIGSVKSVLDHSFSTLAMGVGGLALLFSLYAIAASVVLQNARSIGRGEKIDIWLKRARIAKKRKSRYLAGD